MRTSVPSRLLVSAAVACWAACAGGPQRPQLYDPGEITAEQKARLHRAEQAYRAEAPEFVELRDELAADPVTAFWLTRLFVRDVLWVLENRPVSEQEFLQAAAGARHPVEARAREQIAELGAAAMPCLVEDLLKNRLTDRRELGVDLVGEVGAPAIPAVLDLVRDRETRHRRAGIRALGALPPAPETMVVLEKALDDPEFTVRADAARALGRGGSAQAARLRDVLVRDADPFVRRVAAETLAHFPTRATAAALIDYLERCQQDRDAEGAETAQASLQRIAQSGPRTVEAWRKWLDTMPEGK